MRPAARRRALAAASVLARASRALRAASLVPRRAASGAAQAEFPRADFVYMPEAVTVEEADLLLGELLPQLKRRRYESDHWDAVIVNFREFEVKGWKSPAAEAVVRGLQRRVEAAVGKDPLPWLPRCHVIDLAGDGYIRPHVDSVKYSGGVVAGLSLLSPAVMRFRPSDDETGQPLPAHAPTDFVVEPRSLYVMKGDVRYHYTHEILPRERASDAGPEDGRRISLMMRDELASEHGPAGGLTVGGG